LNCWRVLTVFFCTVPVLGPHHRVLNLSVEKWNQKERINRKVKPKMGDLQTNWKQSLSHFPT
jgi:hypothetical protein